MLLTGASVEVAVLGASAGAAAGLLTGTLAQLLTAAAVQRLRAPARSAVAVPTCCAGLVALLAAAWLGAGPARTAVSVLLAVGAAAGLARWTRRWCLAPSSG